MIFPGDEEWNANAAFERRSFRAAQGIVDRAVDRCARHRRPAIVTDENDERVFLLACLRELFADAPDVFIQCERHGFIILPAFVGCAHDLREPVIGRVHGGMNGVEGQIQEPWVSLVALDEFAGFTAKSVGEIFAARYGVRAPEHAGPLEIALRSAEKTEELIKAPLLW